jgi:hypothetical protein
VTATISVWLLFGGTIASCLIGFAVCAAAFLLDPKLLDAPQDARPARPLPPTGPGRPGYLILDPGTEPLRALPRPPCPDAGQCFDLAELRAQYAELEIECAQLAADAKRLYRR